LSTTIGRPLRRGRDSAPGAATNDPAAPASRPPATSARNERRLPVRFGSTMLLLQGVRSPELAQNDAIGE
jgi:hypothetical protein